MMAPGSLTPPQRRSGVDRPWTVWSTLGAIILLTGLVVLVAGAPVTAFVLALTKADVGLGPALVVAGAVFAGEGLLCLLWTQATG